MSDWIKVREFATRFEAEFARARLESADVPATIVSHEGGMFGAGFQGPVTSGVEVRVPKERIAEAEAVLETDLDPTSNES
jgi:hypothetical protein